jgi:hypothetical protein
LQPVSVVGGRRQDKERKKQLYYNKQTKHTWPDLAPATTMLMWRRRSNFSSAQTRPVLYVAAALTTPSFYSHFLLLIPPCLLHQH